MTPKGYRPSVSGCKALGQEILGPFGWRASAPMQGGKSGGFRLPLPDDAKACLLEDLLNGLRYPN
jgi:hypothetical protein